MREFTGLTDKNRVLIHNGDICKWIDGDGTESYFIVTFEKGSFVCDSGAENKELLYDVLRCFDVGIVGNIYSNPELAEEIKSIWRANR